MNPILFPASATTFNTNGIGRLKCVSCEVTEERNGAYELEAEISVDTEHYADIVHSAIIAVIPFDGGSIQAFRIYKITKPLGNTFTVYARHISYQLTNIPTRPFTAQNVTSALAGLKSYAIEACPFTFWTDKTTAANYSQMKPESIRARLGGQQGSILDVYGGEYEWDNWNVKLWNNRGADNHVTLRYGKNIIDLKQEENIENTITGIVPYWCSENSVQYYNGVVEADTAENFPYKRTVPYDFSEDFENEPTPQELKARAERYIIRNQIGIPAINITVNFVALWQTEEYKDVLPLQRVNLCDYVTIEFEKLGIQAKAKVIKTVYDVLNERYSSISLGEARTDLASYIVGLHTTATNAQAAVATTQNTVTEKFITFEQVMNDAIEDATDSIVGAKGGNVVTRFINGKPSEILIMDNTDMTMAKNVWRWNIGGLGYSSSGINGPYGTAITLSREDGKSGQIVADFITAGQMTADIIKVGRLEDLNKTNYWDMKTGEFKLTAGAKVGSQTLQQYTSNAANTAVNAQTQDSIFNKLTNGGKDQGIYLKDGRVYINAEYLRTGIIKDATGQNMWDLGKGILKVSKNATFGGILQAATGSFSGEIKGGSIKIGGNVDGDDPNFKVDTTGKLTCKQFDVPTGNAGSIGCDVLHCNSLDVSLNANVSGRFSLSAGTIDAPTITGGYADFRQLHVDNPPWAYDDSDKRLKENIQNIDSETALKFLLALSPKSYKLKKTGRDATGFIAQDILKVMSELGVSYPLVKEKEDGFYALNYTNLIALIVSAIQNLVREVRRDDSKSSD